MNHAPPQSGQPNSRPSGYALYRGNERDSQINLRELFNAARRGKWIILFVFWLCTAAAIAYTLTADLEYEARSVLLIHNKQNAGLEDLSFDPEGLGLLNEIELLRQSIPLAERVAARLIETAQVPETGEALPILHTEEGRPLPLENIARLLLNERVHVVPVADRVSMIRITAKSSVAGEAALIVNFYAEEYQKRNQETSRASITASRQFLLDQEARYQASLESTEARLEVFMQQEGAVALDTESSLLVRRVAEIDAQIGETRVELGQANASLEAKVAELERIEPGLAARIASGVEDEIGPLRERIAQLEAQANDFYANDPSLRGNESSIPELVEIHDKIQRFRNELEDLSRQYVAEVMSLGVADVTVGGRGLSYVADLKRDIIEKNITIRGLQAKLEALELRVQQYEGRLQDLPRKSIEFAQLQREKQAIEQIYLMLGQKAQEARVAEESELGYVEIVRLAVTPSEPVRPQKQMNIMLGMLVGLAFGFGLAFLWQALDHRIYRPEDLTKQGVNVIGVVPKFDRVIKAHFGKKDQVEVDGTMLSTLLIPLLNPFSPIAECYRGLHTSIQFGRSDKVVETILVSSALPQEGKSVTSMNLAITIARSGRRTLYVDADLRRPRGHQLLGLERKPGLSDLLLGKADPNFKPFDTGIEGLYALTAGRAVPNPAELLGSKRMRYLVDQMKKHFDVVIFDTAPVLLATDAILLSTQCDVALIVVAAGQTNQVALNRTRAQFDNVGAPLIGAILNQFDSRGTSGFGYDYGYGHGYYDRYGYYSKDYEKTRKGLSRRRANTGNA
ncbi:MAG: GumC family protein [Rhodothermales bacterium]